MRTIAILSLAALTSACGIIGEPIAEKVADVVDRYCEEPEQARNLYRATINAELDAEGHQICVDCAGDVGDCPQPE